MIETFAAQIADFVNGLLGPPADFLESYVWKWPRPPIPPALAWLLLGAGLYVTLRLVFIQVRGFRHAIGIARGRFDDPKDEGDLKHFQALTTALSATVGIGNIAGVAIAIRLGGPGALFWMWVTAFFGMALKYVECTLALQYRKINADGSVSGGPMYYIELGLGSNWKWLALLFAGFATIASFGGGCMNQSNTLATQLQSEWGIPPIWSALLFAGLVASVIIGGIRRIGFVTSILAPSMAALYVAGALGVLVFNIEGILPAIGTIFTHAFAPEPLVGGGVGSLLMTAMWGIRRGLFSNEAGQGSAPIAHATAKTKEPVREGLVASLGPFIDTLVICTMTGLVIVTTGVFKDRVVQPLDLSSIEAVTVPAATDDRLIELRAVREATDGARIEVVQGQLRNATLVSLDAVVQNAQFTDATGRAWSGSLNLAPDGSLSVTGEGVTPKIRGEALLTGSTLTARAFSQGMGPLGGLGSIIVTIAVVLFAVSTGISWSYYGDRSVEYLFGAGAIPIYRWVFVLFFFMGSILPLKAVWTFGDVALGLMTIPNLLAIFLLTGGVVRLTREYFSRDHKPYW